MSPKEFKELVAKSPSTEWYLQFKWSLSYPHLKFDQRYEGIPSIYDFVNRQVEAFEKMGNLPSELKLDKSLFDKAKRKIVELISNDEVSQRQWDLCLNSLKRENPKIFLPNSPEGQFLQAVFSSQPDFYKGAHEYLSGTLRSPIDKSHFNGYLLAYEFCMKEGSETFLRKNQGNKALADIRSDLEQKLSDVETHSAKYISDATKRASEYSARIDELKKEKEILFSEWFENAKGGHDKFCKETDLKIKEFEDLYQQKLKLEAPANYWSIRAKKLRKEGGIWLIGLLVCVFLTIGLLIWLLNKLPDGSLDKIFQNNGLAIKWSIALITLISFFAFAIRIFSKLTFSSFHLARDAEEREQLTYVYLALQKEKGVDQTERHLIMQSLFSRADSGLLKDEASPTMPGNIMDQVVRK